MIMSKGRAGDAPNSVISPRLPGELRRPSAALPEGQERGCEVSAMSPERSEGGAGEGEFPRSPAAGRIESLLHPHPVPASGEREPTGASGSSALYRLMAWLSPAY